MTTLGDDTEAYGTQESQSGVQVTQADYMPRGLATPTPCVGSSASSLPHYPIAHGQALPEHANSPYARYYALAPAADDHLSLGGYYPPAPGIPDRPLFGRYYGLAPGVADRHSAGTASYAVDPALHAPTSGSYAVQFSSGGASSAGAEQARPDIPGMVEEPQFRMQYRYSHRHVLNGHQGRDPGSENGQLGHTGHMPYRLSPFDLLGDVSVAPSTSSIASVTHAGGWEIVDSVGLTYGQAPDTGSWCPLNPQCTHARGRRPLGSQEEFQAHMQEHRQSLDGYLHLTGNSTLLCPGVDAGCLYDKLYCLYSADCERGLHGKTGVPCKDVRAWKAHMKNHFVKESGRHSCPTCGKSFGRKHELSKCNCALPSCQITPHHTQFLAHMTGRLNAVRMPRSRPGRVPLLS